MLKNNSKSEYAPAADGVSSIGQRGSAIAGVEFRALKMNVDARGIFTEVFQDNWNSPIKPVQWSVVKSAAGVLRGMHVHKHHDEYFALLSGRASVGLRDMRPWSATHGACMLLDFDGAAMACVAFPRGLLHGWYFHEDSIHLQAVSEAYVDYHTGDNFGCHWADPEIGIPWPVTEAVVAKRAAGFPSFQALAESLASWTEDA